MSAEDVRKARLAESVQKPLLRSYEETVERARALPGADTLVEYAALGAFRAVDRQDDVMDRDLVGRTGKPVAAVAAGVRGEHTPPDEPGERLCQYRGGGPRSLPQSCGA